jgi:4,5-DOPA dioxygenase extradiol
MSATMPAVFVGHGNPMNAITDNTWSRGFAALGGSLPRPRAALVVSAHFYEDASLATGEEQPRTIHDFGGFPPALFEVQYPAPGAPALAQRVTELIEGTTITTRWGLDHGAWSVLVHVWPDASVPVVQLSIDARLAPADHVAIGRALGALRDEGVMVIGSGNIVHNLRDAFTRMRTRDDSTPDWAIRFDADTAAAIDARDLRALEGALETEHGRVAHPTPEHYLPLLYVMGAARDGDTVTHPITGFDLGSLSMRSIVVG